MVKIDRYQGQLGNALFQYALARLLSEHFGYAMDVPPLLNLPHKLPGTRIEGAVERLSDVNGIAVDMKAVYANRTPRCIVLDGFFQQAWIYEPHRDKIREWLKDSLCPISMASVVAHIRFGEYYSLGWTLPVSYYEKVAARVAVVAGGYYPCVVLTDEPWRAGPYLEALKVLRPELKGADNLTDLRTLIGAKFIISSNSSFGWWGAFLSHAEHVWRPHNWQPFGISQEGNKHWPVGSIYPGDLRLSCTGWHTVDMNGGTPCISA